MKVSEKKWLPWFWFFVPLCAAILGALLGGGYL